MNCCVLRTLAASPIEAPVSIVPMV